MFGVYEPPHPKRANGVFPHLNQMVYLSADTPHYSKVSTYSSMILDAGWHKERG